MQVSFRSDNKNCYFTYRPMYLHDSISLNSYNKEKLFRKKCRENQTQYFLFENRAVNNIMWEIL